MQLLLARDDERFEVSERLSVLPLRDVVLFPHMVIPLLVGRAGSLASLEEAVASGHWITLVAQRNSDVQEPAAADLFRVGVAGRALQLVRMANGTTKVLVEGVARVRVTRYASTGTHLRATISDAPFAPLNPENADESAMARRVLTLFEEYVGLHRRLPAEIVALVQGTDSVDKRAFAMAAHLLVATDTRQRFLEARSISALYQQLAQTLAEEIEILRLERKIESEVRGSLFQNQREFYLQEQLKAIHRELGQDDGDDFDGLAAAIARKGFPAPIAERAERELRKLRRTSPLSPESSVGRNYLDWLLALPWTERTDDVLDIAHARAVLDGDHHGLDEVKDRILDYIAVLSLVGKLEGPILCLVGPPGVGKTSLGRSVARALGRKFVRMSLGGVRDEAEIRGHRRTYIGSMPGRVIQAMRRAGVVNPVILLDEVDKMGQDWRGDPSAALLEVLDPEQNRAFSDHYLEADYDLSPVLFITTANSLAQIPDPLRDRMEIIRLPGYVDHEKYAIARRFLIPRQLALHGIDAGLVTWEPDAVPAIVQLYTREAGVRELERRIARIARKLARRAAAAPGHEATPVTVRAATLPDLLGVAPYDWSAATLEDKIGVATGLAFTAAGGELLEIEVAVVPGRGRLQLTGTLGDVLKESATAAMTYARSRATVLGLDDEFHAAHDLHVHIPAGATPKDGPSAGIAIAVAMVSALTRTPVRGDIAMTGEITLRGRVLPIGGLKEKSVAAVRNGITDVILPERNVREVAELPEDIRDVVHFHPVSTMDEVLALALRNALGTAHTAAQPVVTH
ncbi:MAG TPA: endopeptidase La [Gemmatimonadaceae bacterium]|nr:endopeptidase La [Gemmatimonadaceae bacterium]